MANWEKWSLKGWKGGGAHFRDRHFQDRRKIVVTGSCTLVCRLIEDIGARIPASYLPSRIKSCLVRRDQRTPFSSGRAKILGFRSRHCVDQRSPLDPRTGRDVARCYPRCTIVALLLFSNLPPLPPSLLLVHHPISVHWYLSIANISPKMARIDWLRTGSPGQTRVSALACSPVPTIVIHRDTRDEFDEMCPAAEGSKLATIYSGNDFYERSECTEIMENTLVLSSRKISQNDCVVVYALIFNVPTIDNVTGWKISFEILFCVQFLLEMKWKCTNLLSILFSMLNWRLLCIPFIIGCSIG